MTNTNPTFASSPTANMLKNAIAKARRAGAASKLPLKAFRTMKRDIANAIVEAVKDGKTTIEFATDARLISDVDRVTELNTWFTEANLKSPGVKLQQGAGGLKEAVLTIDLT